MQFFKYITLASLVAVSIAFPQKRGGSECFDEVAGCAGLVHVAKL